MKRSTLSVACAAVVGLVFTGCSHLPNTNLSAPVSGAKIAYLQLQPNPRGSYSYVTQLNGAPTGYQEELTGLALDPGEHTVNLALSASPYHGQAAVTFTAEPERVYKIRTMQHGIGFRVRLWDETDGRLHRTLIAEHYVSGRGADMGIDSNGEYNQAAHPQYQLPKEPAWVTSQIRQTTQQRLNAASNP